MLTEDFELSLPLTPYRSFDPADVEGGRRRVLVGVEGMISDTASLTVRRRCLSSETDRRKKERGDFEEGEEGRVMI